MTPLLIAAGVFVLVFAAVIAASYLLFRWLLPKDDGRPRNLLGVAPIFALKLPIESAVVWLWIWLAVAFGIGLLWAIWSYVGPWMLRKQTGRERHRWSDGSPRTRVTDGQNRLELIKGLKPGQQPDGGKR